MTEAPQTAPPGCERPPAIARALAGATGRGLRIAVIDSGCDPTWNDPRIRPGIGLTHPNDGFGVTLSGNDRDAIGHGTACCDIILGMAPEVEVLPIRVFGRRLETSPSVIVAAFEWAQEQGVTILNLSLGSLVERSAGPLYRACEQARRSGLIVVSAVDLRKGWSYPAIFDNTLGVTAGYFGNIFDFQYFPNAGVECRAQGVRRVRWLQGHRQVFGSSFAAPHISAWVALLLERFPGSTLEQVRDFLALHALPGPGS